MQIMQIWIYKSKFGIPKFLCLSIVLLQLLKVGPIDSMLMRSSEYGISLRMYGKLRIVKLDLLLAVCTAILHVLLIPCEIKSIFFFAKQKTVYFDCILTILFVWQTSLQLHSFFNQLKCTYVFVNNSDLAALILLLCVMYCYYD